jgi:ethanolamine utilization protein EutA
VFCQNVQLPLKNLPVVSPGEECREGLSVLALSGVESPGYARVQAMAEEIAALQTQPLLICLEQDMAKALGQALAVRLPPDTRILCIDRVRVDVGCYLDIGHPVGGALPVVVKTLVLSK